uniref:Uncharacterized protein n=1 Tax=Anguilla anguilla TaxID=7936 RepID=A0A0E9VTW2_ANGAN
MSSLHTKSRNPLYIGHMLSLKTAFISLYLEVSHA